MLKVVGYTKKEPECNRPYSQLSKHEVMNDNITDDKQYD